MTGNRADPIPQAELARRIGGFLASEPAASQADLARFVAELGYDRRQARQVAAAIYHQQARADQTADALLMAWMRGEPVKVAAAEGSVFARRLAYHQLGSYLALAEHGVELERGETAIPAIIRQGCQHAWARSQVRNRLLYHALGEILGQADANGVPVILLKGAALASTVYPSPAARVMSDLDLLIAPSARQPMQGCLDRLGYMERPISPELRPPPFLHHFGGSSEFERADPDGSIRIDLHWQLTNSEWLRHTTAIDLDRWQAAAVPWHHDGMAALQLAPHHQLAHAALHFLKHKFGPGALRMLLDIDAIWRVHGPTLSHLDWLPEMRQSRLCNILWAALWLSQRCLGTPIDAHVLAALQPRLWQRRALARVASADAFPAGELAGWPKLWFEFLLLDRPLDALTAAWRVLWPSATWMRLRYELDAPTWRDRWRHLIGVLRSGEL